MFGACMSPERYEIMYWYSFSAFSPFEMFTPLSYTLSFSLGSMSS